MGPALPGYGRFGILIALLLGGRHVIFVIAVSYTTVADVVVIVSTTPLFAAFFSAIGAFYPEMGE